MAMSRLCRALDVPGLITTIMKQGYRFNAERID
jgi:uroporphyrinogen-III synthase